MLLDFLPKDSAADMPDFLSDSLLAKFEAARLVAEASFCMISACDVFLLTWLKTRTRSSVEVCAIISWKLIFDVLAVLSSISCVETSSTDSAVGESGSRLSRDLTTSGKEDWELAASLFIDGL